jgi:hypothetical protein
MKIDISATDEDGIKTELSFDNHFEDEQDFAEFMRLVFKVLVKAGVNVPDEIAEELDNI